MADLIVPSRSSLARRRRAVPTAGFTVFALFASAPAILLGVYIMHRSGISTSAWMQNIGAWIAGLICVGIACLIPRRSRFSDSVRISLVLLATAVLGCTFCFAGLQGVHRWLELDGLRLHAGAIVLPACVILIARIERSHPIAAISAMLGIAALLTFQPDAGEASAFALACGVLIIRLAARRGVRVIIGLSLAVLLAIAWSRPDPLPAIAHVEGIVVVAGSIQPWLKVVAVVSLTLVPIPFLIAATTGERGENDSAAGALALFAYFTGTLLAPIAGNFPVPLMGFGLSPFIGYFCAIGWLLRKRSFLVG